MLTRNQQDELSRRLLEDEIKEQEITLLKSRDRITQILSHLEREQNDILKSHFQLRLIEEKVSVSRSEELVSLMISSIEQFENLKKSKKEYKSKKVDSKPFEAYDTETGWHEKIEFILSHLQKAASMHKILGTAIELGENLKVDTDEYKKATGNISAVLKTYIDRKELMREKMNDKGPYHYGLPEWFVDGKLQDEYKP